MIFVPIDDLVGSEFFRGSAGRGADLAPPVLVGEDFDPGLGHGIDVANGREESGLAVPHDLGHAADIGRHDGDAARHPLERGEAEGLGLAGQEEEVRAGEELGDGLLLAEEDDA